MIRLFNQCNASQSFPTGTAQCFLGTQGTKIHIPINCEISHTHVYEVNMCARNRWNQLAKGGLTLTHVKYMLF